MTTPTDAEAAPLHLIGGADVFSRCVGSHAPPAGELRRWTHGGIMRTVGDGSEESNAVHPAGRLSETDHRPIEGRVYCRMVRLTGELTTSRACLRL